MQPDELADRASDLIVALQDLDLAALVGELNAVRAWLQQRPPR